MYVARQRGAGRDRERQRSDRQSRAVQYKRRNSAQKSEAARGAPLHCAARSTARGREEISQEARSAMQRMQEGKSKGTREGKAALDL
jgi:hypothetical protein